MLLSTVGAPSEILIRHVVSQPPWHFLSFFHHLVFLFSSQEISSILSFILQILWLCQPEFSPLSSFPFPSFITLMISKISMLSKNLFRFFHHLYFLNENSPTSLTSLISGEWPIMRLSQRAILSIYLLSIYLSIYLSVYLSISILEKGKEGRKRGRETLV